MFELGGSQSDALGHSVLAEETGGYLSSVICPSLWEEEGRISNGDGIDREKTVKSLKSTAGVGSLVPGTSEKTRPPPLTWRMEEVEGRRD